MKRMIISGLNFGKRSSIDSHNLPSYYNDTSDLKVNKNYNGSPTQYQFQYINSNNEEKLDEDLEYEEEPILTTKIKSNVISSVISCLNVKESKIPIDLLYNP